MKILLVYEIPGAHAVSAAIANRRADALKVLLQAGFKPDAGSLQGCAFNDDPKCLRVLMEHVQRFPESWLTKAERTANFATRRNSRKVRELLARARQKSGR
jgi:hypothetical protein